MVQARLNGYLPTDFDTSTIPTIDLAQPREGRPLPDFGLIEVADGRFSDSRGLSEAERFAIDGFVLLPHATRVRDWDGDVEKFYLDEVEAVIRQRLYPGVRVEVQQRAMLVRRGRDTTNAYAGGIHSDGPLSVQDYAANVAAFAGPQAEQWWLTQFNRPEVESFVQIDFWRTTNMSEPLRHMPLALCRPASLDPDDIVATRMKGIAPNGNESRHLLLRYNPEQRWFYFPEMTSDEMLAFKLCEFRKDSTGRPQNVFHTAFEHPETPDDAQQRQSCEHRVGVLILKD